MGIKTTVVDVLGGELKVTFSRDAKGKVKIHDMAARAWACPVSLHLTQVGNEIRVNGMTPEELVEKGGEDGGG